MRGALLKDQAQRRLEDLMPQQRGVVLHVVPEIGGRIVQYQAGGMEFLWVNPEGSGKAPSASGLASDGGWLNYGLPGLCRGGNRRDAM